MSPVYGCLPTFILMFMVLRLRKLCGECASKALYGRAPKRFNFGICRRCRWPFVWIDLR